MRRAFSYARFSTWEQMDGRSLKRQEAAAKAYCGRHGLALDEQSFTDLGVSAYKGSNATHGELAAFRELVREGRIPKGSVLIVENTDRLSRMPPDQATELIMSIVKAGVDIVTTSPEQVYSENNIHQPGTWIPLQVACCLASEESRKKGERLADAWAAKRQGAAGVKLTKKGLAWLKLSADRRAWVVDEEKAAWVRRIFALAVEGFGAARIAGVLNKECPQGLSGKGWQPSYVACLLRSRSVLGEYQPHTGTCAKKGRKATRKPFGEPVKGYFPSIISEADFYKAQQSLDGRRHGGGRMTGTPNLFNSILYDASDGRKMVLNATHGNKILVSSGAIRGLEGSAFRSVRYEVFERAVLSLLAELKPADILGRPGGAEDRVAVLSGKLTAVNAKLDAVKKRAAEEDDISVFLDLMADLDRQRKRLIGQLEKARGEAASREGDNLGEFVSLVELLDAAEPAERDVLRRKARAALRRLVREVWLLVVPRGRVRLYAAQVFFAAGGRRDYAICYHPARKDYGGRTNDQCWARSLATVLDPEALDLRDRAQAQELAAALEGLDPAALEAGA